ncbi:MAG: iron-sulfur cluster assembly scaffold protein, partial [Planctomycetota bacterium]
DVVVWMLDLDEDERITGLGWDGRGCNLSQAGASMLSERLAGMSLREVLAIPHNELIERIGPRLALTRPLCSNLALNTIKTAAYRYFKEHGRPVPGT